MRSTETAPRLVAASRAIHEALAAAELTTDERGLSARFPVLLGFANFACLLDQRLNEGVRFR
jgi:hypothetical protein